MFSNREIAVLRVCVRVLLYNMRVCIGVCYCKWLSKLFLLHYLIETTTTAAAYGSEQPPVQNRTTSGIIQDGRRSMVIQIDRDRSSERRRFQLLVFLHLQHLLQFVVVDDILVGGTGLREGVQLVHMVHVSPQGRQVFWYLKVDKVLAGHPDVLQSGHQLAVEAAHGVAG